VVGHIDRVMYRGVRAHLIYFIRGPLGVFFASAHARDARALTR